MYARIIAIFVFFNTINTKTNGLDYVAQANQGDDNQQEKSEEFDWIHFFAIRFRTVVAFWHTHKWRVIGWMAKTSPFYSRWTPKNRVLLENARYIERLQVLLKRYTILCIIYI